MNLRIRSREDHLTDPAMDCLIEFKRALNEERTAVVEFDCEGWGFKVVSDDWTTYVIVDRDAEPNLLTFDVGKGDLAKEIIKDIRENLDVWADWFCYDKDPEAIEKRKEELENKVTDLEIALEVLEKSYQEFIAGEKCEGPELGHMMFGNMAGCHFPLDREAFEKAFQPLMDAGFDSYGYYHGEWGFSNDVFSVQPYWWGDEDAKEASAPNFLYKPTGLEIRWYKYMLRDAYANKNVSIEEMKEIIAKCVESMKGGRNG